MKELKVHMIYYLEMLDGETEQQAIDRFHCIVDRDSDEGDEYNSSMQIYDTEVEEYYL